MLVTSHFSLDEFEGSEMARANGIDNRVPIQFYEEMRFTLAGMERIREVLKKPLVITSGYRCQELNKLVGGEASSQHLMAQACDFVCPRYGSPGEVFARLCGYVRIIGIDQLILEGTWVHVSFSVNPRYMVLTKTANGYSIPTIN